MELTDYMNKDTERITMKDNKVFEGRFENGLANGTGIFKVPEKYVF